MMYRHRRLLLNIFRFCTYFCTCILVIAAVIFSFSLVRKTEPNIQAESVVNTTEIDFVWEALRLNSIVQDTPATQSEKVQKIDLLAKQANTRVQAMAVRMNKYAGLFGADWYSTQSQRYNQLLNARYPQNVFLLPTLSHYEQALRSEIETQLRTRSLLTTISFEEFDKYRVVIDNEYVEFSHTIFESNVPSGKVWFSPAADRVIAQMAQARGFLPKKMIDKNELEVASDGLALKNGVRAQFDVMQQAAAQEGVVFSVISAYRDPEDQQRLFAQEMQKYGVQINQLASEEYINKSTTQDLLDKVMNRVAPPEYSRHHTGITLDLVSPEGSDFGSTQAFQWLSKNNYYNAKKFGFLPSYPKLNELTKYGPNPEAWEYFYAGLDNTLDPNHLTVYEAR